MKILYFFQRARIIVDENGSVFSCAYAEGKMLVCIGCHVLPLWKNDVVKIYSLSDQKILIIARNSRSKLIVCQQIPLINSNREFMDLGGDFAVSALYPYGENDYYSKRRWEIYSVDRRRKELQKIFLETSEIKLYMAVNDLDYASGVLTADFQDAGIKKSFCKKNGLYVPVNEEEKQMILAEKSGGKAEKSREYLLREKGWKPVREVFTNFDEVCET